MQKVIDAHIVFVLLFPRQHEHIMTATTKSKIAKLHSIILAKYTAAKNYNPEFATKCAMELILKIAMNQPKPEWCDQILDEEIEDNLKAANA